LPRRAADQYTHCQKIEPDEALAGDLVFFTNGTQINHVGILISDKGAPKQMIHASSSIGISVVDIENSNYWTPKIAGYGRIKSAK
jgi:cell wall-associated NlpC family hydrolase